MPTHEDDEPVMVGYNSDLNITFNNRNARDELGYTWGQWRAMSPRQQEQALQTYLNTLAEVWVIEDSDEEDKD